MNSLYDIYVKQVPQFLLPYLESKSIQRLKDVDMNCGLQFTSHKGFSSYESYSRYEHSLGVACIIYHFTNNKAQALSGLFHDIATRSFAHVIDFVHRDYLKQETTEDETKLLIASDDIIMKKLQHDHIHIDDVCDYHRYPIADNDSPKLSADRLEYTLGSLLDYRMQEKKILQMYYDDLVVGINEYGEMELMFQSADIAYRFAKDALRCGMIFSQDFDRYAMEKLASIIRKAFQENILSEKDLYLPEKQVVNKIEDSILKDEWIAYTNLMDVKVSQDGDIEVDSKKRYINPYICKHGRVSTCYEQFKTDVDQYLSIDYHYKMKGIYING